MIPEVKTGQYTLVAENPEYESDSISCEIRDADTTEMNLSLTFNSQYWSEPTKDATYLFFEISDRIKIDSTLAGKIQYRLDIARTYDASTLDTLYKFPLFELGDLLLRIPQSIYEGINFETMQFNHEPIDSICAVYNLKEIITHPQISEDYKWIKLIFPEKYNMPVLAREFKNVSGVLDVCANYYGTFPEGPNCNIHLEIDGETYQFEFYLNVYYHPDAPYHFWQVHVVDDRIVSSERN